MRSSKYMCFNIVLFQVFHDFPKTSANIPFPYFFDIIPVLQPRAFSIASSLKVRNQLVRHFISQRYATEKSTFKYMGTVKTQSCLQWLAIDGELSLFFQLNSKVQRIVDIGVSNEAHCKIQCKFFLNILISAIERRFPYLIGI